jgi:RNA polymerase sigma-70 factor (ECF subfamily)
MAKRQVAQPHHPDDDAIRIARIQRGDAETFDGLVSEYGAELCEFVFGIVESRAVAEEIVQDLFCRLWDRRHAWNASGSVAGYLFRAAHNRALNAVRGRRVELAIARHLARAVPGPRATTDQQLYASELAEHASRAIASLPERCRMVFVLHRSHSLTYQEIADVMNVSPRTVEVHMARALAELRRRLAPWLPPG